MTVSERRPPPVTQPHLLRLSSSSSASRCLLRLPFFLPFLATVSPAITERRSCWGGGQSQTTACDRAAPRSTGPVGGGEGRVRRLPTTERHHTAPVLSRENCVSAGTFGPHGTAQNRDRDMAECRSRQGITTNGADDCTLNRPGAFLSNADLRQKKQRNDRNLRSVCL